MKYEIDDILYSPWKLGKYTELEGVTLGVKESDLLNIGDILILLETGIKYKIESVFDDSITILEPYE